MIITIFFAIVAFCLGLIIYFFPVNITTRKKIFRIVGAIGGILTVIFLILMIIFISFNISIVLQNLGLLDRITLMWENLLDTTNHTFKFNDTF